MFSLIKEEMDPIRHRVSQGENPLPRAGHSGDSGEGYLGGDYSAALMALMSVGAVLNDPSTPASSAMSAKSVVRSS